MAYFLLAWNPSRYSDANFNTLALQQQQGTRVELKWSVTHSRKPEPGDKFFIIKLGSQGRGIFGSGNIVSAPREGPHYDSDEAENGATLLYVDIEFEKLVNGYELTVVDMDELGRINEISGVNQQWSPRGSGILIDETVAELLERIWNERTESQEHIEEKSYFDLTQELDSRVLAMRRKEQAFLKKKLFGQNKYAPCSICGELLPVQFLICAHIKKRSECEDLEKRDFKNIVTPMCRFGCDELYERGHIAVHNGKVVDLSVGVLMNKVSGYMKSIVGRECPSYIEGSTNEYYEWHYQKHCSNKTLNL